MRIYTTVFVVLAAVVQAGAASPVVDETKQGYTQIKTNILKAAEKMPEADYGFQPTPEERTFAALVGHIADAQTRICSSATGTMKPGTASGLTAKAALVAALNASFSVCEAAMEGVSDDNAMQMVSFMGRGQRSKIGTLNYNVIHDNESYGTMAVYLRLKGIVPPSSEK